MDTDKIIAAIFTASICGRAGSDQETYLQTFDEFLEKMDKRKKAKKKPMRISDKTLAQAKRKLR
jgi:hypothetical protein